MSPALERLFWAGFGFSQGYLTCWLTPRIADWLAPRLLIWWRSRGRRAAWRRNTIDASYDDAPHPSSLPPPLPRPCPHCGKRMVLVCESELAP